MTPPDDLSPPRRPIFLPVVIATVFLTIITMTIGFTLGERHRRNSQATDPTTPVAQDSAPQSQQPLPTPSGKPCRDVANDTSIESGYGPLAQRLMIRTKSLTVWICANYRGALFYQSYTHMDRDLVQGTNGLFLPGVQDLGGSKYRVTDTKGNVFKISKAEFEQDLVGKDPEPQPVIDSES